MLRMACAFWTSSSVFRHGAICRLGSFPLQEEASHPYTIPSQTCMFLCHLLLA